MNNESDLRRLNLNNPSCLKKNHTAPYWQGGIMWSVNNEDWVSHLFWVINFLKENQSVVLFFPSPGSQALTPQLLGFSWALWEIINVKIKKNWSVPFCVVSEHPPNPVFPYLSETCTPLLVFENLKTMRLALVQIQVCERCSLVSTARRPLYHSQQETVIHLRPRTSLWSVSLETTEKDFPRWCFPGNFQ